MTSRSVIFLVPLLAFARCLALAQSAESVPPEVDAELRARVAAFYQAHVDQKFLRVFELGLVAEDTKESYFSAEKVHFNSFKIDDIKYSENFTKAVVTLTVERTLKVELKQIPITTFGPTSWKLENGKWVWYKDPELVSPTPMGTSNQTQSATNGTPPIPAKITTEAIADAARGILRQSSVNKTEVVLTADKASSDEVKFHNGAQGPVQVVLDGGGIPGFQAELDKTTVAGGEDAIIRVRYQPAENAKPTPFTLRLTVRPFNQVFAVSIRFDAAGK